MASPNSSHARVFVSIITRPTDRLALGVEGASHDLSVPFYSLMAPFTSGVHQYVLGLPPSLAPVTTALNSCLDVDPLRFHAPHYLWNVVEALQKAGVEDHFQRFLSQISPAEAYYSLGPA